MKLPSVMFGLLLGMCVVTGIMLASEEPPDSRGTQHSTYSTMQRAGQAVQSGSMLVWLGWTFGILQIFFFVTTLALGASYRGRLGNRKWIFIIGGLFYGVVFTLMIISYRQYVQEDSPSLFLSFPKPTSMMVFGLWAAPSVFLLLYIVTFNRWILTATDLERFRRLIAASRQADGSTN